MDEADVKLALDEAAELLRRYGRRPDGGTWRRNLEALALPMVINPSWNDPLATVGELCEIVVVPLLEAAFEMGRQAAEASGQSSVVSGQ